MLHVVACPRCRRARVVEAGRKTAQCASCASPLELPHLRAYWTGDDPAEARHAAGLVNARLAHRDAEFATALLPQEAPRAPKHDDALDAAAAATRGAKSEKDRVDRLVHALGSFDRAQLEAAFARAGLRVEKLDDHLRRLVETCVLVEPRSGRYRAA